MSLNTQALYLYFIFFVMIQKGFRLIHVFMSLFLDPLYRPLRVQFRVQDLLGNGGGDSGTK